MQELHWLIWYFLKINCAENWRSPISVWPVKLFISPTAKNNLPSKTINCWYSSINISNSRQFTFDKILGKTRNNYEGSESQDKLQMFNLCNKQHKDAIAISPQAKGKQLPQYQYLFEQSILIESNGDNLPIVLAIAASGPNLCEKYYHSRLRR